MWRWDPENPPENENNPQDVRIVDLEVEAWSENWQRVRVNLQLTPFSQRPNLEAIITDAQGKEAASIYIVESIDARMAFTMHIRGSDIQEPFALKVTVVYPDVGAVDQREVRFGDSQSKT